MPESARFQLSSPDVLGRCFSTLSQAPLDGSVEVAIRSVKETHSDAQRRLYWAWLGQLSDHTGYDKDELHRRFKRAFLRRIYLEDPVNATQQEWVDAHETVQELVVDVDAATREKANQRINNLLSTTWADTSQLTQYLTAIEEFCFERELPLARTDDYQRAMT